MAAELAYFKLADRFNIIDKPNLRSSHTTITLRGGGIVFYFGAMAYFIVSHGAYPWFMLGLTMIAAVSFVDDLHSMPNRIRLMIQFIAMLLMFHQLGFLVDFNRGIDCVYRNNKRLQLHGWHKRNNGCLFDCHTDSTGNREQSH